MSAAITAQSVYYVKFIDGKKPSRIRKWPQAGPGTTDLPEGPVFGRAPERCALLVLGIEQDSVRIGNRTRVFRNPHTDAQGRVWRYVRAYDRDSKAVVQGWVAETEGRQFYLKALQPVETCNVATADAPGMLWRPTNLKARMDAYVVSKLVLNVRQGPGCETADVGNLTSGTVVEVLEGPICRDDGRVWWRIKHNGRDGWVCENEPAGTTCAHTPDHWDSLSIEWNLLPLTASVPTG